ncbi:CrcB-like protein-domain-containing protein [Podospora aff. communis PSN243]|uniref:CrcB-like protein-domain-containing protein n=1 Tax=Podospora aff. communis PSN243 TaxID=3040156 RepID=A0AAV9G222_9PEZI|nr:CrcB-like protein-domain-containing protein [Podospora aff. communis PSN243]
MAQKPEARRLPEEYDPPESYYNLDDAVAPPLNGTEEELSGPAPGPQRRLSRAASEREARNVRRHSKQETDYDVPDAYTNLNEVTGVSPVQNPDEESIHQYESLEHARAVDRQGSRREALEVAFPEEKERKARVSRLATQIYTISYLILFSLLGTLARLGLQALTIYPGMPTTVPSHWPNFAGSFIMGFLTEDRMLFSNAHPAIAPKDTTPNRSGDEEGNTPLELEAAKKAHMAHKKTIPLYIGLATGFCGCFTSFSSFMRDLFLALSNDLTPTSARNGGYSLASVLAVLLTSISLSLSALFVGAHLAIAVEPVTPSLPYSFMRKVVDRVAVPIAFGAWLAVILLCIFPPNHSWRGAATFALAFAPLGCLLRFFVSLRLNSLITSFPLGTFTVNIAGTALLGMAWDLAHVPLGGVVGCQVFQGIEDGFCGCLTTVSTWVVELSTLRRKHAYTYGGASVAVGFALMVVIMGGLRWGRGEGFVALVCVHSF